VKVLVSDSANTSIAAGGAMVVCNRMSIQ
jgi:hypothetical protein